MRGSSLFLVTLLLLQSHIMAFARWGGLSASASATASLNRDTMINGGTVEEHLKTKDVLSLDSIRSSLIRQEETIIFALIERAQFHENGIVYERGGFGSLGTPLGSLPPNEDSDELSFLEYMLLGTEVLHCGARRYTSPEEHPFFPERLAGGPLKALPSLQYPEDLLSGEGGASDINFNKKLLAMYIEQVVPALCTRGDDEQHGSASLCDIAALQALSRRVHYGKFVAESKYRADPLSYQRLVDANDAEGVMTLLTDAAVEGQVVRRAWLKAATYGTEPLLSHLPRIEGTDASSIVAAAAASAVVVALEALNHQEETAQQQHQHSSARQALSNKRKGKVDPSVIESIYRDIIIPLTKEIEVAYLFRRCGKEPPPHYQPE